MNEIGLTHIWCLYADFGRHHVYQQVKFLIGQMSMPLDN